MSPTHTPRFSRAIVYTLAAILASLALCGCVGAPRNVADLDKMPEVEFQDWKLRTAAVAEEAAFAIVASDPRNLKQVEDLSMALEVLCKAQITPEVIQATVEDPAYAGLLRIATLELAAVVRQRLGPSSHPRLQELVCAFADALQTGALRGLETPVKE